MCQPNPGLSCTTFPIRPVLNECGHAALRVEPRRVRRCFPDLLGNGNIRRSGNDPSVPNSCDYFWNTSAEIRVYDKCDRVVHRYSSYLVARIHLSRYRRIEGIRSRLWSVNLACGLSRRLTARGLVERFNVEPARRQVHFRVAERVENIVSAFDIRDRVVEVEILDIALPCERQVGRVSRIEVDDAQVRRTEGLSDF